ncbi:RICIN domain-containing protein, partial [Gordonibacter massiliensis (ex Traore et al. 2017)]
GGPAVEEGESPVEAPGAEEAPEGPGAQGEPGGAPSDGLVEDGLAEDEPEAAPAEGAPIAGEGGEAAGGAGEPAPAPALEDGDYTIASALDPSLLLDVPWASESAGEGVALYRGKGVLNQRFRIERGEDGFYSIRAVHSALALDVEGASAAPAAGVIQWPYSGAANQRWGIEVGEDGLCVISSMATGMVLDVAWGAAVEGARVQVFPANGGANQRFALSADESVPLSDGLYSIGPSHAPRMRLDIDGSSASAGANVLLWEPNLGSNQKFQAERVGDSEFTFRSLCSGLYLAADGANVCQMPDGSSEAVRWRPAPGLGGISLVSVATGLCMDVDWAGSSNGCNVGLWQRNGQANQAFRFSAVPVVDDGCYALVSAVGGRVLDVSWASRDNGAPVVAWSWHDAGNQKWNVASNGDGTYRVASARSRKVLDTEGATGAPGSAAIQWEWNGGSNQRWEVIPSGDGWFYLRASNGLYLDVAGAGDYDGVPLQGWGFTGDGSAAQRFRFMQTSYVP